MFNLKVGITNILLGLLLIAVCIPLAKRKIKMNLWYGMRLPKAFKSEENWYKINEYGGRQFIYWSVPVVLFGVIMLFLPPVAAGWLLLIMLLPVVFMLAPIIKLFIYSSRL
jgi:uncharacterized membrane protein